MNGLARKKMMNRIMSGIFTAGAVGASLLLFAFILFVVGQGVSFVNLRILHSIQDMFFNTLYLVFLALVFSALWGIPAGVYLSEYAQEGRLTNWVRMAVETLSSLPSIVVGLFGYLVFIVMTGSQWNLMAGALSVSILTLPLMTSVTENALRDLPPEYTLGSLGLGASKWQTIWNVLLPACLPRIMTGLILAAGRGFGEAAALMFTAGMSTDIDWSNWDLASSTCPLNPFRPGETLALHVWVMRTEALSPDAAQIAGVTSAILMTAVVVFNVLARYVSWRLEKKMEGVTND
ncbi:phosphate ABC transporter permease PstA [Acidaminococcus sp. NSJ-142]|jgi:phosphate transport system permease protein|uniref:phosphate ABC transporter permease PstA n=1 Tax=Acidaminococcus TaxID=904 RepID=UPI000CFA4499|nr:MULTISPECIES: phosphate ABC transporter permease PstA [Acidaminococcus]MCD2434594.1 phosphate ABC transporter permease PstA [Acidaminococcus hominis]MCH4096984.1 phosphate ABC transporter permease PstA [Acidaminococcus provencensis]RHK03868.1 phosphate ABC transporter permease PstA [Acidaminococcus sp. AM05-11]